jgi:hypothetical protein
MNQLSNSSKGPINGISMGLLESEMQNELYLNEPARSLHIQTALFHSLGKENAIATVPGMDVKNYRGFR